MADQGKRIVGLIEELVRKEPFFGHLVMGLRLIETDDDKVCPSMGTDGLRLYYNSKFTAGLPDNHLEGVLAHEALHLAYFHAQRVGDRDKVLFNIAADAVINPILKRRGYELPQDGIFIPVQRHETTEEVYERLKEQQDKGGGKSKMPAWGMVNPDQSGDGESGQGLSAEEEHEAMMNVAEAMAQARKAGKMPGEFEMIVNTSLYGQRDWKDFLRKFLGGGHERTRSWSRRNKRFPDDVIMPGMGTYGPGEIAVFIDTSGSINESLGQKFMAEVRKLQEDMVPDKVHVVCCDAVVQWTRTYSGYEQLDGIQFRGRGGTDFRPPFKWLKDQGIEPKAVVYFTDLECSSFPEQPDYPVAWIVWPGGADRAPWGEIVRMGS